MELAGSMRPFCRCVLSKSRDDAAPRCPLFLTQFGRHSRLVLDLLVRLLMYFLPLLINEQTEVVSMEGLSNDVRPPQVPQSPLHQVEPSLCLRLAPIHVKVHDGVVEAPCGTDTISEHPMPSFHSRQNVRPRRHNGELYLSDSDPGATVKDHGAQAFLFRHYACLSIRAYHRTPSGSLYLHTDIGQITVQGAALPKPAPARQFSKIPCRPIRLCPH